MDFNDPMKHHLEALKHLNISNPILQRLADLEAQMKFTLEHLKSTHENLLAMQAQHRAAELMLVVALNRINRHANIPRRLWREVVDEFLAEEAKLPGANSEYIERVAKTIERLLVSADIEVSAEGTKPSPFRVIDGGKSDSDN